jgi:hypothetical protein
MRKLAFELLSNKQKMLARKRIERAVSRATAPTPTTKWKHGVKRKRERNAKRVKAVTCSVHENL